MHACKGLAARALPVVIVAALLSAGSGGCWTSRQEGEALRRDIERLQEAGLIRGGSLDNAILVDEDGIQGSTLRFPDEFVRHKLLDLVGDLALLGCSLEGRIVAWRAGHGLHGRLVDAILAHRQCWSMVADGSMVAPPAAPAPPGGECR